VFCLNRHPAFSPDMFTLLVCYLTVSFISRLQFAKTWSCLFRQVRRVLLATLDHIGLAHVRMTAFQEKGWLAFVRNAPRTCRGFPCYADNMRSGGLLVCQGADTQNNADRPHLTGVTHVWDPSNESQLWTTTSSVTFSYLTIEQGNV
jgi:hypothetical protein